MSKRTVAILVLAPLGALVGFGVFRMIQHDFALAPAAAKEEPKRSERQLRPDDHPQGPDSGEVTAEMLEIYHQQRDRNPPDEAAVARFNQLAAGLELRHLHSLLDELQAPGEPREVAAPFLLALYSHWSALEPVQAWEKVREEAYDADKADDRTWAAQRLTAILDTWVRTDADKALAAFMEVERGTEVLRGAAQWWTGLPAFFEFVAKALADNTPERLRGMADAETHAVALGLWARARFTAGGDPLAITKSLVEEANQAAGGAGNERRLATFRDTADEPFVRAWFEKEPFAAMNWYSQGRGGDVVLAYLEQGYLGDEAWVQPAQMREFLMALSGELRDQWIATWLSKTAGADLSLLTGLSSPELRWKFLMQAAWPKVAEPQQGFQPWACDPADVREAMNWLELTDTQRAEIEQILSAR